MTTKQVAAAIRLNVIRYYSNEITWEQFNAEQRRLWDYAQGRSERFSDLVAQAIMPPFAPLDAECGLIGTR